MVYRRGPEQMSAFAFEYQHAKQEGVRFLWYVQPVSLQGTSSVETLELIELEKTADDSLVPKNSDRMVIPADLVILAIGQSTHTGFLENVAIKLERGHVLIDRLTGQTSNPRYFAGGDCTNGGREVVDAVADGKRAGIGIAAWLEGQERAHA